MRIKLVGEDGKMGRALAELIAAEPKQWKIVFDFKSADVIIDFSSPEGLRETIKVLLKNPKPLVSGTTGITDADHKLLKKYSAKAATLWSANTSLGVSVLRRALKQMAALEGFHFQIEEVHHTQKKDAPSGTAKVLQKALAEATGAKLPDPISIRAGGVPGTHKVFAYGSDEVICFEHQALNRKVFAVGALKIAKWIQKKKPKLYEMDDFLNEAEEKK